MELLKSLFDLIMGAAPIIFLLVVWFIVYKLEKLWLNKLTEKDKTKISNPSEMKD